MEEIVKQNGFESLKEYHRMVANVNISDANKLKDFSNWLDNDSTKIGILKLSTIDMEDTTDIKTKDQIELDNFNRSIKRVEMGFKTLSKAMHGFNKIYNNLSKELKDKINIE